VLAVSLLDRFLSRYVIKVRARADHAAVRAAAAARRALPPAEKAAFA
jgi:hypothetical protein